jgi:hypothetical protein
MAGYGWSTPTTATNSDTTSYDVSSSSEAHTAYVPVRGRGDVSAVSAASSVMPALPSSRPSSLASPTSGCAGGNGEVLLYPSAPPGLSLPISRGVDATMMVPGSPQVHGPQQPYGQAPYGPHMGASFVHNNVRNNMHAQIEANLQQNLIVGVDPNEVMRFAASAAAAVSKARNDAATAVNCKRGAS